MNTYLPYIVTLVSALISGFASYFASRRQAKADMQKLEKQHELDIEKERELFAMEKEKMELEHKHQLELLQKENEQAMGVNFANTILTEAFKMPEVREQLAQGVKNGARKKQ